MGLGIKIKKLLGKVGEGVAWPWEKVNEEIAEEVGEKVEVGIVVARGKIQEYWPLLDVLGSMKEGEEIEIVQRLSWRKVKK